MSGAFLCRRALAAALVVFGSGGCNSDSGHAGDVDGSAPASGGVAGASGASSGGLGGSKLGSGGAAGNAGVQTAGGASGAECRTTADCPQTNCFGCPGSTCVNGRCITATSGAGGSSGTGGISGGGTSGASLGTVSIVFTVAGPETYCSAGCMGASFVNIRNPAGEWLTLSSACSVPCDTCVLFCPPGACAPEAPVTGMTLDWTGAYLGDSTCGSGTACEKPMFAAKGKYTAQFCATPGTMTHRDGGASYCKQSGAQKCTTVDFDYPTSSTVRGTLGP